MNVTRAIRCVFTIIGLLAVCLGVFVGCTGPGGTPTERTRFEMHGFSEDPPPSKKTSPMVGYRENYAKALALSAADVEKFYQECRKDRLSLAVFYGSLLTFGKVHEYCEAFCRRSGIPFRSYFESMSILNMGPSESFACAAVLKADLSFAGEAGSPKLTAKEREEIDGKFEQYIWVQRTRCMASGYFFPFVEKCSPCSMDDGSENDFVVRSIRDMKYWEARYIFYFYNIIMDAVINDR